jgi:hypothetical protein
VWQVLSKASDLLEQYSAKNERKDWLHIAQKFFVAKLQFRCGDDTAKSQININKATLQAFL